MNSDIIQAAHIRPAQDGSKTRDGHRRWSLRAIYVAAYLAISLPALIALCFATGPFQVADEPSHFFRAIQLSHGQAMPVVSADRKWAGGYIDRSAGLWTWRLGFEGKKPYVPRHFTVAEVAQAAEKDPGPPAFAPFNNTVIYFPVAHLAPALAISAARHLSAQPMTWFYAGRLANALTAAAVCAAAIFLFEDLGLFALVICTLPMVLFEQASLSSDALVLSFSVLFAALLARIARGYSLKPLDYAALTVALIYVSVAKFAYMPLVLAPPLVALIQKRDKTVIARLAAISAVVVGLWAAWSFAISDDVLSGRVDRSNVDIHRQLAQVLHQPLGFVATLARTLMQINVHPLAEMLGSRLGALDLPMPKLLSGLSLANLVLVSVYRPTIGAIRPLSRLVIAILAFGSVGVAFLLLYLQFNPVGQPWIEGFQGRYLLPVLPLLPLVAGAWPQAARRMDRISLIAPLLSAVGAAVTVLVVAQTYWR